MSSYFKNFKKVLYLFGDEVSPVVMQNLTNYSTIVDKFADEISAYLEYEIKDFERPDTLSHQLYDDATYDWTFFLMNPKLREQGWPLAAQEVYEKAQTHYFKDWTCKLDITTADSAAEFASKYPVGSEVFLGTSKLLVKSKNLQVGEITVASPNYSPDSDFSGFTTLTSLTVGSEQLGITNTVKEMFGTHHYENTDGDRIDFYFDDDAPKIVKTNLDYLIAENDKLKRIRVIRKPNIAQITGAFKSSLGQ